jgi:hypothetical protein
MNERKKESQTGNRKKDKQKDLQADVQTDRQVNRGTGGRMINRENNR